MTASQTQSPNLESQLVVKPKDLKKAFKALEEVKNTLKSKELLFAVSGSVRSVKVQISTIVAGEPIPGCSNTALMMTLRELEKKGFAPYWIEAEGKTLAIYAIPPEE